MSSVKIANTGVILLVDLTVKAKQLRNDVLDMCVKAGTGHVSSCFSCVEIMVALFYGGIMKPEDKFILSKGHASPLLYAILADKGIIDKAELDNFAQPGGRLGVHLDHHIPGALITSGSLGIGLGIGAGMAIANPQSRIFVLMGDGECAEGSVWEAAMFIAQRKLNNIVAIVDCNGWGVIGKAPTIGELADIWGGFGWKQHSWLGDSFHMWNIYIDYPNIFLCQTIKGKGISFMENDWHWHGVAPQGELAKRAKDEISA